MGLGAGERRFAAGFTVVGVAGEAAIAKMNGAQG